MKYITLISSKEYFFAGLVLNQTLKDVKSRYPLVIAVTEDLDCEPYTTILSEEDIEYVIIPKLYYPDNPALNNFISTKPLLKNTASKIALFNLPWDEKLLFLDGDMFVRKNIDHLFDEYPSGSMLWSATEGFGMSGLFIFNPRYHSYKIYKILLEHYNDLDGGIIGDLFFPVKENASFRIPCHYITEDLMLRDNTHLYHCYGNDKPFLLSPSELQQYMHFPAYQMYCRVYLPLRIKYKNLFDF